MVRPDPLVEEQERGKMPDCRNLDDERTIGTVAPNPLPAAAAIAGITEHSGSWYDPAVVDALLRHVESGFGVCSS